MRAVYKKEFNQIMYYLGYKKFWGSLGKRYVMNKPRKYKI